MEKEFVKYEQALALKELGFDEPCMMNHYGDERLHVGRLYLPSSFGKGKNSEMFEDALRDGDITAILYQQAFRFFREKYNLQHELYSSQKSIWLITIRDTSSTNEHCIYKGKIWDCDDLDENIPDTYEEAESACLDKLIEIVKNK